jgi:ABC transporter substrate binding protein
MSYDVNLHDLDRRAATYVDKILKGAKPADIPVEQPTKFEFIISLTESRRGDWPNDTAERAGQSGQGDQMIRGASNECRVE